MYPNSEGLEFNKAYYTRQHGQLFSDILGDAIVSSDINYGLLGASPDQTANIVVGVDGNPWIMSERVKTGTPFKIPM